MPLSAFQRGGGYLYRIIILLGKNDIINAIGEPNEFVMPGTNSTAFKIEYELSVSVREDIYDYITHTSELSQSRVASIQ